MTLAGRGKCPVQRHLWEEVRRGIVDERDLVTKIRMSGKADGDALGKDLALSRASVDGGYL